MARKGSDLLGNILDSIALMPWWAGAGLAVVAYFLFREISLVEIVATVGAGTSAAPVVQNMIRGVAMVLQQALPVAFTLAALVSAWIRYRRYRNYANVAGELGQDALEMLSWREFEQLVGDFSGARALAWSIAAVAWPTVAST